MNCDNAGIAILLEAGMPNPIVDGKALYNFEFDCILPKDEAGTFSLVQDENHFCVLAFLARRLATEGKIRQALTVMEDIPSKCPQHDGILAGLQDILPTMNFKVS